MFVFVEKLLWYEKGRTLGPERRRLGVIGAARSGLFLTSWQLCNHFTIKKQSYNFLFNAFFFFFLKEECCMYPAWRGNPVNPLRIRCKSCATL